MLSNSTFIVHDVHKRTVNRNQNGCSRISAAILTKQSSKRSHIFPSVEKRRSIVSKSTYV